MLKKIIYVFGILLLIVSCTKQNNIDSSEFKVEEKGVVGGTGTTEISEAISPVKFKN
ncbi:MAG: hypothetical protein PHH98_04320 [Candidatus Gracilibacteria bacterium]|nr:hypothetical protein [Candidatus Gracilibacteria bacterium]